MGRSIAVTRNADTQISATGSANAVMYTVPTDRKFVGWVSNEYASDTSANYYVKLIYDSITVDHRSSFSSIPASGNSGVQAPQVTLLAGSSAKNGSTATGFVWGVESDA